MRDRVGAVIVAEFDKQKHLSTSSSSSWAEGSWGLTVARQDLSAYEQESAYIFRYSVDR
jgi:hypothetical protein